MSVYVVTVLSSIVVLVDELISIGQFDSLHFYSSIDWSFTTLGERIVRNFIFNFLLLVIQRTHNPTYSF